MNTELQNYLDQEAIGLESVRKKKLALYRLYRLTVVPISALLSLGTLVFLIIGVFLPPFFLWALATFILGYFLSSVANPKSDYIAHLKEKILPEIFKKINTSYVYTPYGFSSKALEESSFFKKSFFSSSIKIVGEDHVKGIIDNVNVEFFEVKFYKEVVNYGRTIFYILFFIIILPVLIIVDLLNDGDGSIGDVSLVSRRTVNHYSGLFLHADFNKTFQGEVILMPKEIEKAKDKLNDKIFGSNYKKIQVESNIFNKKYSIFCSNEQQAFYVLSPAFLSSIEEIILKETVNPMLTFNKGKMFMSIPWDKDYFEADLKKRVEGGAFFHNYINEIESFEKIIKHLKLNQNLWSKV